MHRSKFKHAAPPITSVCLQRKQMVIQHVSGNVVNLSSGVLIK